jgi:hypothetical protein
MTSISASSRLEIMTSPRNKSPLAYLASLNLLERSNLSWFMSFLANLCAKFLGLALLSLHSRFPIEYSFGWALSFSYRSVGGRSWFTRLIEESFRALNVNFRYLWSSRGSIDVISASFNSRSIDDVVKVPVIALDCLLISFWNLLIVSFWPFYYNSALYRVIDWTAAIWTLLTSPEANSNVPEIAFSLFSAFWVF